jgi:hypothetical protein
VSSVQSFDFQVKVVFPFLLSSVASLLNVILSDFIYRFQSNAFITVCFLALIQSLTALVYQLRLANHFFSTLFCAISLAHEYIIVLISVASAQTILSLYF